MKPSVLTSMPAWLTPDHEAPRTPDKDSSGLWSENYLLYVWSPNNNLGVFTHLCHRVVDGIEIWDELLIVALPNDRYLVSKGMSPGYIGDALSISGMTYRVEEPFTRLTTMFHGGARLITGEELRRGPVEDGVLTPVFIEMKFEAMTAPFDLGGGNLDQSWAHGHYEQHQLVTGKLTFEGQTHEIDGTGLRDHSWGLRDARQVGTATWVNGQFPGSGRGFLAMTVTGVPPKPEFSYAVVASKESVIPTRSSPLPLPKSLTECAADYEFELILPSGESSTVRAQILNAPRVGVIGPSEFGLGTFAAPVAHHHCIDAFTRFEWDGEVGYGITERVVDLTQSPERQ